MRTLSVGAVLLTSGIVIFGFSLIRLIGGHAIDPQTSVPGVVQAPASEAGRVYLWDNHWTVHDGERVKYAADCPADAEIKVRDADGNELPFTHDSSQAWSIGNNAKTSVGYVEVTTPTDLTIDVRNVGRERVFSVSSRSVGDELWSRLGGLGIGAAIGVLGLAIFIVGSFLRRRAPATDGHD